VTVGRFLLGFFVALILVAVGVYQCTQILF
jgi:hypothetical protein